MTCRSPAEPALPVLRDGFVLVESILSCVPSCACSFEVGVIPVGSPKPDQNCYVRRLVGKGGQGSPRRQDTCPTRDHSDRCHELVLPSTRLNDPPPTMAGIDLFTSIDQPEGLQNGHIPLHCFPIPPECRREF